MKLNKNSNDRSTNDIGVWSVKTISLMNVKKILVSES